jgi:hypothetical protein
MTTLTKDPALFAAKIAETEEKLEALTQEIAEIGQPAGATLRRRLDALRVEENALHRNFLEAQQGGAPDSHRMEQAEVLLHHIEREEASIEHEADFLHQGNPSSVVLAAEAGARVAKSVGRGVKRILRGRQPLGHSVFVNHSYDTLVNRYGLDSGQRKVPKEDPGEE